MNGIDIALIVLLAGIVILAIRKTIRSKGSCGCSSGGSCCGSCESCPSCSSCTSAKKSKSS